VFFFHAFDVVHGGSYRIQNHLFVAGSVELRDNSPVQQYLLTHSVVFKNDGVGSGAAGGSEYATNQSALSLAQGMLLDNYPKLVNDAAHAKYLLGDRAMFYKGLHARDNANSFSHV
jgi:hypothetical protein